MATPRRIVVASPIEPSGASWLLNCLLELGIKVRHRPVEKNVWRASEGDMWIPDGDTYRLHPRAEPIAKWLPSLDLERRYLFRQDVEVVYVQEFPSMIRPPLGDEPGAFFVRDPRDALYSAFRRQSPDLDYDAFLAWPNGRTLLDRVAHWTAFAGAWTEQPGIRCFRFEDYKVDDRGTLKAALHHLRLAFSEAELERAVSASTFEKAREAEVRYQERYPGDKEVANRAGRVGDWRMRPELAGAGARIELRTASLLRRLGYPSEVDAFVDLPLEPSRPDLLSFARRIDAEFLSKARLPAYEVRMLLDGLLETLAFDGASDDAVRLAPLRAEFADGSAYHLAQVRALLATRRPRVRTI